MESGLKGFEKKERGRIPDRDQYLDGGQIRECEHPAVIKITA
jgi:hypothetical protein